MNAVNIQPKGWKGLSSWRFFNNRKERKGLKHVVPAHILRNDAYRTS